MRWLSLIKPIGLVLLGVVALAMLAPMILSVIWFLGAVLIVSLLLFVGTLGAKFPRALQHFYTWYESHHLVIHRHPGHRVS
jgi:hypothetical protein